MLDSARKQKKEALKLAREEREEQQKKQLPVAAEKPEKGKKGAKLEPEPKVEKKEEEKEGETTEGVKQEPEPGEEKKEEKEAEEDRKETKKRKKGEPEEEKEGEITEGVKQEPEPGEEKKEEKEAEEDRKETKKRKKGEPEYRKSQLKTYKWIQIQQARRRLAKPAEDKRQLLACEKKVHQAVAFCDALEEKKEEKRVNDLFLDDSRGKRARKNRPTTAELLQKKRKLKEDSQELLAATAVLRQQTEAAQKEKAEAKEKVEALVLEAKEQALEGASSSKKQQGLISAFFKASKGPSPLQLLTDPSVFRDSRGRKSKAVTVESAKKATESLAAQQALVTAVEEAQEKERQATALARQLVAVEQKGEVLSKRAEKGETRGRKKSKTTELFFALEDPEEQAVRQVVTAEHLVAKKRLLMELIYTYSTKGKREDMHPVKRAKLTELIDLYHEQGKVQMNSAFWKQLSTETQTTVYNLKQLLTKEGRALTQSRIRLYARLTTYGEGSKQEFQKRELARRLF